MSQKSKQNKHKSGRAFEIWCRNWLKDHGYLVHLAGKKAIKIKNRFLLMGNDIFGIFDIIAMNREEIRLIQCSKHESIKKRLEELEDILFIQEKAQIELWIKRPAGAVDIFRLKDKEFVPWGKIIRKKLFLLNEDKK